MTDNPPPEPDQQCWPGLWQHVAVYGSTWLVLGLAIMLAVQVSLLLGLVAAMAAGLTWLTVQRLLRQKAVADQAKCLVDEQLLQSQKLAALGQLSAGLAHEINNPLAIIRQEAEWLLFLCRQSDPLDMTEAANGLRQILQQVDRSREITTNLLNFARRQQPVVQAVNLNRLVADMVRLVAKEVEQRRITVVSQLAPELPVINSDGPLLRQVILNLLNNAIQAIGQDGTITVATEALAPDQLTVQIRDTGCGIPPEHLARIFDPFFTTKGQGQGTGLGLSICHGIIERLGGTITVTSEVGKGSTFTVKLPITLTPKEI